LIARARSADGTAIPQPRGGVPGLGFAENTGDENKSETSEIEEGMENKVVGGDSVYERKVEISVG
jgi:hypothetical protein